MQGAINFLTARTAKMKTKHGSLSYTMEVVQYVHAHVGVPREWTSQSKS